MHFSSFDSMPNVINRTFFKALIRQQCASEIKQTQKVKESKLEFYFFRCTHPRQ